LATQLEKSWDQFFLELCDKIAERSKDPSTKVGAVITNDNNQIIAMGYNGFPKGINDDNRLNNRETKYRIVLHAEENAILNAGDSISNATKIYISPLSPCSLCSSRIIQTGIKNVIVPKNYQNREQDNLFLDLFSEAGIAFVVI